MKHFFNFIILKVRLLKMIVEVMMRNISCNEIYQVSAGVNSISINAIDFVPGKNGEVIPRWTPDGGIDKILIEGAFMAMYVLGKYLGTKT